MGIFQNIYHKIQSASLSYIFMFIIVYTILVFLFYILSVLFTDYKGFKRRDIKNRGKQSLKNGKFWTAVLVTLVASFMGVGTGVSLSLPDTSLSSDTSLTADAVSETGAMTELVLKDFLPVFLIVFFLILVIALAMVVFLSNIVLVSMNRFFIENLDQRPGFKTLFWGFRNGRYMKICVSMFAYTATIMLFTLLFFIPGIIKYYQYYMVPYIIAENPDIGFRQAARISKNMMKGNKWRTYVLEISFMGWHLLGAITFGIGTIFISPYVNATFAALYERLRLNIPEEDKIAFLNEHFKAQSV